MNQLHVALGTSVASQPTDPADLLLGLPRDASQSRVCLGKHISLSSACTCGSFTQRGSSEGQPTQWQHHTPERA